MSFLLSAANWFSRQGLPALASAMRHCIRSREVSDPLAFHQLVDRALDAGNLTEAERLGAERLAMLGEDRDARLRLGHMLLGDGRVAAALGHFQALDAVDGRRE